jgi:hypothetical protein
VLLSLLAFYQKKRGACADCEELCCLLACRMLQRVGAQFACFTGTKVRTLTCLPRDAARSRQSMCRARAPSPPRPAAPQRLSQYLYFCTSNASKLGTCAARDRTHRTCPLAAAMKKGVWPCVSRAAISAPQASAHKSTSVWPVDAARRGGASVFVLLY